MLAPNYIKSLFKPNGQKPVGRKVWSIDLETVWLPFFTATNADGVTMIPNEALGAPLRLACEKDGTPKFRDDGRPVIKVAKDIGDHVKLVRENFVAGLQAYANNVATKQTEAYKEQVRLNHEAGRPIVDRDRQALESAIEQAMRAAMDGTPTEPAPEQEPAPVGAS